MSRIRLHKHLFTSLLFHAIISALLKWHLLQNTIDRLTPHDFQHQPPISSSSYSSSFFYSLFSFKMPSLCLVLSVLLRYFRSTTYLWMFNEALYLHQLIKHAFSQPSLRPLIISAYCLPFMTTTFYIFARSMSTTSNLNSIENSIDFNAQFFSNFDQNLPNIVSNSATRTKNLSVLVNSNQLPIQNRLQNDQVQHAISTLIQLPAIQQHLQVKLNASIREPNSAGWLNDLLKVRSAPVRGLEAERFVAEEATGHKSIGLPSSTDPHHQTTDLHHDSTGQSVLDNLEALEDSSLLVEEDNCWLVPSYESWHEWIINLPNLAILIVSIIHFLSLSLYILYLIIDSILRLSTLLAYTKQKFKYNFHIY